MFFSLLKSIFCLNAYIISSFLALIQHMSVSNVTLSPFWQILNLQFFPHFLAIQCSILYNVCIDLGFLSWQLDKAADVYFLHYFFFIFYLIIYSQIGLVYMYVLLYVLSSTLLYHLPLGVHCFKGCRGRIFHSTFALAVIRSNHHSVRPHPLG